MVAQCQVNQAQTVIINSGQSISWTQNMAVNGDIYVEPTGTLIVSATITMCEGARIIVKRGGRLEVLNNGTITGNPTWIGIEVHGNPNVGHPPIGQVYAGNYPSSNLNTAINQHGVVIISSGTLSQAVNAITTKAQTININTGECCVEQSGNRGGIIIARRGARFENNRRSVEMLQYLPNNISLFDDCEFIYGGNGFGDPLNEAPVLDFVDHITMWDVHGINISNCLFTSDFNTGFNRHAIYSINADYTARDNNFDFLNFPIEALNTMTTSGQIIIDNNRFYYSWFRAVLLDGVDNAVFINNTVDYFYEHSNNFNSPNYGLFLDGCDGYEVENNKFFSNLYHPFEVGIIANQSGNGFNEIYNNPKFDIYTGIGVRNNNSGLQIKCNNITSATLANIISSTDGAVIAPVQGICDGTTTSPAGNLFSHPCSQDLDIAIDDLSFGVNYNHHTGPVTTPQCYTSNISPMDCFTPFDINQSCPDRTIPPPCSSFPFCRVGEIGNVNFTINNLKQSLSQETPNTSPYEEISNEIVYYEIQKGLLYNRLIREGLRKGQLLDVMPLLEQENSSFIQMKRIALYLALKNFTEVNQELLAFSPQDLEESMFKDYYTALLGIYSSGRTFFDITTVEESAIRTIAASNTAVSKKAENILTLVFGEEFPEEFLMPLPSSGKKATHEKAHKLDALRIYPTPSIDYMKIEISNNEASIEGGTLLISDIYGTVVREIPLQKTNGSLTIATHDIPNGTYIIALYDQNKRMIETKKTIILK